MVCDSAPGSPCYLYFCSQITWTVLWQEGVETVVEHSREVNPKVDQGHPKWVSLNQPGGMDSAHLTFLELRARRHMMNSFLHWHVKISTVIFLCQGESTLVNAESQKDAIS